MGFREKRIKSKRAMAMFPRVVKSWISPVPKCLKGRNRKGGSTQEEEKAEGGTFRGWVRFGWRTRHGDMLRPSFGNAVEAHLVGMCNFKTERRCGDVHPVTRSWRFATL